MGDGLNFIAREHSFKQECIPAGYVPSAAVAMSWEGVCLGGG